MEEKNELDELKEKLEKTSKERDEYFDGWKRSKADFINYKKEETERISELIKFNNESIFSELIPVLDSIKLGIVMLENDKKAQKGLVVIETQFEDTLKKLGIEKISPNTGDEFDPRFHEAIRHDESDVKDGCVSESVSDGYVLQGKVIRPAKVAVSKGKN